MANKFVWDGFDELRRELRNLPSALAGDAGAIVVSEGEGAAGEIRAEYERHRRTGNLAKGVRVEKIAPGPYGAGVIVKSTAQHAYIYEHGTQARHTSIGAHRGSMPPGNAFIPPMIRHRRAMYERLRALLVQHGLTVTGAA